MNTGTIETLRQKSRTKREFWIDRLLDFSNRNLKITKNALCYDARTNRYSVVPDSVPLNLVYATEISARALIDSWPFIHSRLLDIGCGSKPYSLFIDSLVSHYVGIDLPSQARDSQSDLWADGLSLPFKMESFDTVLSTDILSEIPSPVHLFQEANRVLKFGGHLVLLMSNGRYLAGRTPYYANYTTRGLRLLVEKNGFNVQVLQCRGRFLPYFIDLAIQVMHNRLIRSRSRGAKSDSQKIKLERLLLHLQKTLIRMTPKRSIDMHHDWEETTDRPPPMFDRFHLGYILIARKVFSLNEYRF